MHSVLLGVARQVTDLCFTATGTDYYCGETSNMAIVDQRIVSLKLPECINRRPRAVRILESFRVALLGSVPQPALPGRYS